MAGPVPPGRQGGSDNPNGVDDESPGAEGHPRFRHSLSGIRSLLLVSLLARHLESTSRRPLLSDRKATDLVERLGLEPKRYKHLQLARLATTIRTDLVDGLADAYLERFDDPTIVTFGAGLCTRCFRLTAPNTHWIDIDLPNVAALRRELLGTAPNREVITSSVLDPRWGERLRHRRAESTLFIAEGILMFLDPGDVRALLTRLAERYPGAELIAEGIEADAGALHPFAPEAGELRWTVGDFTEVAGWAKGITVLDQWAFRDQHPFVPKSSTGQLVERFRKRGSQPGPQVRLGHLRFGD